MPDEIADETPDGASRVDLAKTIWRLLDSQLYGVLCTQGQGQPYGSLVAYAVTPGLESAVFATQRATRKYRLVSECAQVAFVVDNRSALPGRLMDTEAVTATGRADEVTTAPALEHCSRLLIDRHPSLAAFVRSESCSVFRIDIGSYVHVTRFQEVRQWIPRSRA